MKKSSFIPKPQKSQTEAPIKITNEEKKKDESSSDEEGELKDIIPDLKSIPNIYDIPKISTSEKTLYQKDIVL